MLKNLKAFAVVSPNRDYGKQLCHDLLALCRENGCNFLFRVFESVAELQNDMSFDAITHMILVSEIGGSRAVQMLRNVAPHAPIMLLTNSTSDMGALFRQANTYGAHPPQCKEDLAYMMNLLYGDDNRFLPEGRQIKILPMHQSTDCSV